MLTGHHACHREMLAFSLLFGSLELNNRFLKGEDVFDRCILRPILIWYLWERLLIFRLPLLLLRLALRRLLSLRRQNSRRRRLMRLRLLQLLQLRLALLSRAPRLDP